MKLTLVPPQPVEQTVRIEMTIDEARKIRDSQRKRGWMEVRKEGLEDLVNELLNVNLS